VLASLLKRFRQITNAEIRQNHILDVHMPELALKVVRRILRPDALNKVNTFDHHAATRFEVPAIEQFKIGMQTTRADSHHEAALAQMIELGGLSSHNGRVVVRQVDCGRPERQIPGSSEQMREEHKGRGNGLAARREVFAHPQFVKTKLVRKQ
jgi:hypothetical protein